MDIVIFFLILLSIFASKVSIYVLLKFLKLKKKSQIRNSLIGFIVMVFLTGIFSGISVLFYLFNTPYVYIARIFVWFVSIQSLYFLNKYSIFMMNLEFDEKYSLKENIIYIILPIFTALPWNYWDTLNQYEINVFSLQPISLFLILLLSIYVFASSYKRCILAQKKILDPSLNELYSWIHKGIIGISMTCTLLFSMLMLYLSPPSLFTIFEIIFFCSFIISAIGVTYCVVCFYIAFKTPKSLMKSLYKKHRPMWKD